jgi:uncharacterized membrane protein
VAAVLTVAAFVASWYRFASYRAMTMDVAVFEQAVWKLAHLHNPYVSIIGWNAFADHLSPVLVLFAPLYRLAATPLWFFAAQAVAFGAGYLALGPLFDAAGLPSAFRSVLRLAYATSPLLWNAVLFDFHPTTLAVPFLIVGVTAALRRDHRRLILMSVALVLLRDDLGLAVAVLAAFGAGKGQSRADRRVSFGLAAFGLAWFVFGGAVGSALGSDRHWGFHYGYLGVSPAAAMLHPVTTVARLAGGLWRGDNLTLLMAFLLPLGFMPLAGRRRAALALIPALPLLASAGPQFHSAQWHYGAPLFPLLLGAAVMGLAGRRFADPAKVALCLGSAALVGAYVFGPMATHALTRPTVPAGDAQAALALVGPEDVVVADDDLGPHLADRRDLVMFPYPFTDPHPSFPLTAAAREVSASKAATVDTVIARLSPTRARATYVTDFLASPWLADFHLAGRFGDVAVWKRFRPAGAA